ncbi:MAG: hypothetical protein AAFN81_33340, partial [Bacteroidota bacterium]
MLDKIKLNGLDNEVLDKLNDEWKIHCQSEANMKASRTLASEQYAASGFVHYGTGYTNNTNNFIVNEGMWTTEVIPDQANKLRMGRRVGEGSTGSSKTPFPVTNIAAFTSKLIGVNELDSRVSIKFPEAPDGTVTYNKATGAVTTHADATTAFAAASGDVEVVINRVDMFGGEFFLEEAKEVFPYGMIQSQATSIAGIATKGSTRPDTYFAVFDGDTTSNGKCVVWADLTNEQKIKLVSNPDHNLFLLDDGTLVQWRMRQRTVAGAGNGKWFSINPSSGLDNSLCYQNKLQSLVMPQGSADLVGSNSYTANYRNISRKGLKNKDVGVWSVHEQATANIFAINNECYFHVWGVVPRLNQGAYHPSFNPMGAEGVRLPAYGGVNYWYHVDAVQLYSTSDCFDHTNIGQNTTDKTGPYDTHMGNIASTWCGRPDGKFYDAIYASGQGGVIDYRLSAWDMSSKEEAAKVFQKVVNGTYRGEEVLRKSKFNADAYTGYYNVYNPTHASFNTAASGGGSGVPFHENNMPAGTMVIVSQPATGVTMYGQVSAADNHLRLQLWESNLYSGSHLG